MPLACPMAPWCGSKARKLSQVTWPVGQKKYRCYAVILVAYNIINQILARVHMEVFISETRILQVPWPSGRPGLGVSGPATCPHQGARFWCATGGFQVTAGKDQICQCAGLTQQMERPIQYCISHPGSIVLHPRACSWREAAGCSGIQACGDLGLYCKDFAQSITVGLGSQQWPGTHVILTSWS